jgi:hypothetical protein
LQTDPRLVPLLVPSEQALTRGSPEQALAGSEKIPCCTGGDTDCCVAAGARWGNGHPTVDGKTHTPMRLAGGATLGVIGKVLYSPKGAACNKETLRKEKKSRRSPARRAAAAAAAVTQYEMSYGEASSVGVEVAGPRLRRHQGGRECYSTGLAGPNT